MLLVLLVLWLLVLLVLLLLVLWLLVLLLLLHTTDHVQVALKLSVLQNVLLILQMLQLHEQATLCSVQFIDNSLLLLQA